MELEEFHILQWNSASHEDGGAIACERVGVGGDFPTASPAASGEQGCFAVENMEVASRNFDGNYTAYGVAFADDVYNVIFVVEINIIFDTLLIQCLQNHVTSTVSSVACPHDGFTCIFVGMSTKTTLGNFAAGEAVEGQSHMFEFDNNINCIFAKNVYGVLISKVIGAFYGVVSVPFPAIFFFVRQCCANAALRRARMRTGGVKFR